MSEDMNIHNASGRRVPSEVHVVSKPLPANSPAEPRIMADPPPGIPLYRPSGPALASPRRAPPERPGTAVYEKSKPLKAFASDMPAEVPFPIRSSRSQNQPLDLNIRDTSRAVSPSIRSPTITVNNMRPVSPSQRSQTTTTNSRSDSPDSFKTNPTSVTSLAPLQQKGVDDQLEPLAEEEIEPGSFDLVAPPDAGLQRYNLDTRSELLFSTEHLQTIFDDPSLLLRFTSFLSQHRPSAVPILVYYLDAVKALKALAYSNGIAESLEPIRDFDFTQTVAKSSINPDLEEKAKLAFDAMVREDLPAYITHTYIQTVSLSIQRRITGTLPAHLQEASEGLCEVFCLTDPSRPDNPIVFASEEFNKTTQYGMSYIIGHNCRFLQGPKTNQYSVRRIREKVEAGVEHCEVFLNYRRDGSPFMNLLMTSPLRDSRGVIRYFIGAQVDVSGLVKECSDMESLQRLVLELKAREEATEDATMENSPAHTDEFVELTKMLNLQELDTVRRHGGSMHKESQETTQESNFKNGNWNKPRLLINSTSPDGIREVSRGSGKLSGIFENYLLVRPYPSLRVLFASPSLRVPGILQSPFMAKIGGSQRVRDELTQALADCRGVTARVRWVSRADPEGYNRWIHCTPLLGSNGAVGVWMIVIVDEEHNQPKEKRFKQAPPIDPKYGRSLPFHKIEDQKDFAISKRPDTATSSLSGSVRGRREESLASYSGAEREGSPYTLRID